MFADSGGNLKGTITDVGEDYLILDDEITVFLPEGFETSYFKQGMMVIVKGQWVEGGYEAVWVKQIAKGKNGDDPEDGDENGQNAFCTDAKEPNSHPLVSKIMDRYQDSEENPLVEAETVMTWFCDGGFGFGQIMLALTTQMLTAESEQPQLAEDILELRSGGEGWGQIWKGLKLIGDERAGMPPGWVHKSGHTPPGLQGKPEGLPPGLLKKNNQTEWDQKIGSALLPIFS